MTDARSTIITATAFAGGITALRTIVKPMPGTSNAPRVRVLVGTGVVGLVLLTVAQSAPELAANLAILVALTSGVVNGAPVFLAVAYYLDPSLKKG